jgi:hypothetical protein
LALTAARLLINGILVGTAGALIDFKTPLIARPGDVVTIEVPSGSGNVGMPVDHLITGYSVYAGEV